MKTYEEMARDVLKRRDEELRKLGITQDETHNCTPDKAYPARLNKRRLPPRILISCGAAVTAAALGIAVFNIFPKNNSVNGLTANIGKPRPGTDGAVNGANSDGNFGDNMAENAAPTIADKYKGGETEINYNKITEKDLCVYHLPVLGHDDFVAIPDDEINEFYGLKFDRLEEVLGEGEHEPFGYYNHDIESGGETTRTGHGYYDNNGITYNCEDCKINVKATYGKYYTAHVENSKKSVINGFEATVYEDEDGNLCADIDMNGVLVTIWASFNHENIADENYPKFHFEKILDRYTAPINSNAEDGDRINMLDKAPDFLFNFHNPFVQACWTEVLGLKIETIDIDKANELYGVELDMLGKLHKDWKENGIDALEIYYSKPQDELIELGRPNILSYIKPNGARLEVSASTRNIPIPYDTSYINGRTAVLYCADDVDRVKTDDEYPNGDHEYYGIVNFDKCSVQFYSRGFAEKEFVNVLSEFTSYDVDKVYGLVE